MRVISRNLKAPFHIGTLGIFVFFVAMQLTTWLPLRYWHIWGGGNFIDSQQILQWSKCFEIQGDSVFAKEGECSGYIYGSTLLKILSFLNLDVTATQIFGYLFMFVLALTISFNLRTLKKYGDNPLIILIVLSPPVLLLAERGNFDILMFALICIAGFLFSKNHQIIALIPLALATLLKFYSLPLFLLFFILSHNRKQQFLTLMAGFAVFIRVKLDLELIQTSFPSGHSWKFGASIWTRYLTQLDIKVPGENVNNLFGIAILLLTVAFTVVFLKKKKIFSLYFFPSQPDERILFFSFYAIHLTCFLLGMNYDYRLIFLAMASLIYLTSLHKTKDAYSTLVLVLTLLSLWLTYPSTGLEPVGDLTTEILTVILGIRFLQMIKLELRLQNGK